MDASGATLKILPPALARVPERLARFQREAKALAAIPRRAAVYSPAGARRDRGAIL